MEGEGDRQAREDEVGRVVERVADRLAVWERYLRLTREVSGERPELIVWPSSSVPSLVPRDVFATRQLASLAREGFRPRGDLVFVAAAVWLFFVVFGSLLVSAGVREAWLGDPASIVDGRVFDANIFHPSSGTLTFSDHLLLQSLVLSPLYAATGSLALCYNVLLIGSIALSGLAIGDRIQVRARGVGLTIDGAPGDDVVIQTVANDDVTSARPVGARCLRSFATGPTRLFPAFSRSSMTN